jgi:hypothetical protein
MPSDLNPNRPCAICALVFNRRELLFGSTVRRCPGCSVYFVPGTPSLQQYCCQRCPGRESISGYMNSVKNRTFTIKEAIEATGLSKYAIRKAVQTGKLEKFLIDSRIRISRIAVMRLIHPLPPSDFCTFRLIQIQPKPTSVRNPARAARQ